MRVGPWDFNPSLWPTLGAIVVTILLARLGFWQLDRAHEKDAIHKQFLERSRGEPMDLAAAGADRNDPEYMSWRRVVLHGHYDPSQQYLLDNQVYDDKFGYDVFTPFVLDGDGTRVLVNRGWLPGPFDRRDIPRWETPAGEQQLVGLAKAPYRPGIVLGEKQVEQVRPGIFRAEILELNDIGAANGWRLLPYIVRLEPPAPAGWVRDWPPTGSGAAKSLGYAFQWFAMAAAVVIIYIIVNSKRRRSTV